MTTQTQSAVDTLPTEFIPQSPDDFVGPAKAVAKALAKSAAMCMPRQSPAAHLLLGPSGSGKTALAEFCITSLFQASAWNVQTIFGSDLDVDAARDIANSMHYTSLYPGYRVWFFDEFNSATKEARDRALEYCGERKQPKETLILATANMSVAEFDALERTADARGRLTSRFQVHIVQPPLAKDAAKMLTRWMPAKEALKLAEMAAKDEQGKAQPINMRALLKDALTWMQAQ